MLNKLIKTLTITAICGSGIMALHAKDADKATQDKIHDAMEDLKKPSKDVKKLARGKKYTDAKFATAFAKFEKAALRMKNVKHPDKEFNDMNADFLKKVAAVTKAIKGKNYTEIEKAYKAVTKTCSACHDEYKED